MTTTNVLIVDDHPIIANAYKLALDTVEKEDQFIKFNVNEVITIDRAIQKLSNKLTTYDLIFLDIKLPKSETGKFFSGEDLGVEIRAISPKSKIIIATTYNDNYRINNILKSVNPEGFLIKNDVVPEDLTNVIRSVIKNTPYYSETVIRLLRKQMTNDFFLDKIDRQLLYELSIGTKTVDLPKTIPMSIGGIHKRKRQLKELFDINSTDDKTLVQAAKEKGFL